MDNFAGQWLELRNLESIHPDPDEFPEFNERLREAMDTETRMFVSSIIHEDRSILDFIDGKYTFVNERLAKFYGIPGVTGDQFRRVSLDGTERSGVLTQASVLTVTSYPTRTSPVLRGKWVLENILNAPPPPPPPGVGSIDAKGGIVSGTMRQQMEKHRADPVCAGCHTRMDPLGFALENYDAIGRWRTHEGPLPIDASGSLPSGKSFNGSAELKQILASDREAFAECLTEKLLTYALGRGLESYDKPATKKIVAAVVANDYRFSSLINAIVESVPFQMGRGTDVSEPRVLRQAGIQPRGNSEMIITKKHISRRALLRGVGAAVALPVLDAMAPALTAAHAIAKKISPSRMVFAYVPNGIDMRNWTPEAAGRSFSFPQILEPLAPLQDDVLVLTGLMDHNGMALGDGPGDHARASASFLTGVHPKKTAGSDISVGISADQVAARKIGSATRLASLELGCEDGHLAGNCDSGYSCAYVNSISWRTATDPNPPEVNPRSGFRAPVRNGRRCCRSRRPGSQRAHRSKHSGCCLGRHETARNRAWRDRSP